jgi:hypothetical protein
VQRHVPPFVLRMSAYTNLTFIVECNTTQAAFLDFPNLPYLVHDDVKVTQSMCIVRYLGRMFNLLGMFLHLLHFAFRRTNAFYTALRNGYLVDVALCGERRSQILIATNSRCAYNNAFIRVKTMIRYRSVTLTNKLYTNLLCAHSRRRCGERARAHGSCHLRDLRRALRLHARVLR